MSSRKRQDTRESMGSLIMRSREDGRLAALRILLRSRRSSKGGRTWKQRRKEPAHCSSSLISSRVSELIIPFGKKDIAIDILVPICPIREAWLAWRITGAWGLLSAVLLCCLQIQ